MPSLTPMRWPDSWMDPATLRLVQGTAIDYLQIANNESLAPVRARARELGIAFGDPESAPAHVRIVKGSWPGVQMGRGGGGGASAGPTGVPWVDSNGWNVLLNRALHPDDSVWISAPPTPKTFVTADSYLIAFADSAAYGGRWVISLDEPLAQGLAAEKPQSLAAWKRITDTAKFFSARPEWAGYSVQAVVGVVSDFIGGNEFFGTELLNLMGRAGLHYRIVPKSRVSPEAFSSLRAISYTDDAPPSPELRSRILTFVREGGMLLASPKFGEPPGTLIAGTVAGYATRSFGKGRMVMADAEPTDPYSWAADCSLLVSHRYDLVRFFNGGATGSFYTATADRKRAVVHLLFYAGRGPDSASVRIAGKYRTARASTVDAPRVTNMEVQPQGDGVEVHLPQVSQYVALELEM